MSEFAFLQRERAAVCDAAALLAEARGGLQPAAYAGAGTCYVGGWPWPSGSPCQSMS